MCKKNHAKWERSSYILKLFEQLWMLKELYQKTAMPNKSKCVLSDARLFDSLSTHILMLFFLFYSTKSYIADGDSYIGRDTQC